MSLGARLKATAKGERCSLYHFFTKRKMRLEKKQVQRIHHCLQKKMRVYKKKKRKRKYPHLLVEKDSLFFILMKTFQTSRQNWNPGV